MSASATCEIVPFLFVASSKAAGDDDEPGLLGRAASVIWCGPHEITEPERESDNADGGDWKLVATILTSKDDRHGSGPAGMDLPALTALIHRHRAMSIPVVIMYYDSSKHKRNAEAAALAARMLLTAYLAKAYYKHALDIQEVQHILDEKRGLRDVLPRLRSGMVSRIAS